MDRYTLIDSPDLDAAYPNGIPFNVHGDLAESAWRAWQSDGGDLADHQRAHIRRHLRRIEVARCRNAASRARINLATYGPPAASAPLNYDDPDSLDAHGLPFAARALRRRDAELNHKARRARVEQEVAHMDRLHRRLANQHGVTVADAMVARGVWTPEDLHHGDAA